MSDSLEERVAALEIQAELQAAAEIDAGDEVDLPPHVRLACQLILELPQVRRVTVGGITKEYDLRGGIDRVVAAASKAVETWLQESTPQTVQLTRFTLGNERN